MTITIDTIYHKYYRLFVSECIKRIGNAEDAKDITNNVLLKFHSKYRNNSFNDILAVKVCLLRMIQSQCYNYRRDVAVMQKHQNYVLAVQSEAEEYETSFDRLYKDLIIKRVRELIPQLSPARRKVFEMSFIDGVSIADIARKLNISPATVRVQYRECIIFFRKNIKAAK